MTQTNVQFTSNKGPVAGAWRVPPGQALTLKSAHGGQVRVASGGLWATFDGPHAGPLNDRGDHLLRTGDVVTLRRGERLVVEPDSRTEGAHIEWEPGAPAAGVPPGVRVVRSSAPAHVLGSRGAAAALRLVLALAAVGLTAGLWMGAAAESGRHRADPQVLAGHAPRAGAAMARPVAPPATARAAGPRARPPA